MSGDRDERIRKKAHDIWEKEGRPEGEGYKHWAQAEAEVDAEDKPAKKAPAKKAAPKKAPAKKDKPFSAK